jgi:hypothetical protein
MEGENHGRNRDVPLIEKVEQGARIHSARNQTFAFGESSIAGSQGKRPSLEGEWGSETIIF